MYIYAATCVCTNLRIPYIKIYVLRLYTEHTVPYVCTCTIYVRMYVIPVRMYIHVHTSAEYIPPTIKNMYIHFGPVEKHVSTQIQAPPLNPQAPPTHLQPNSLLEFNDLIVLFFQFVAEAFGITELALDSCSSHCVGRSLGGETINAQHKFTQQVIQVNNSRGCYPQQSNLLDIQILHSLCPYKVQISHSLCPYKVQILHSLCPYKYKYYTHCVLISTNIALTVSL